MLMDCVFFFSLQITLLDLRFLDIKTVGLMYACVTFVNLWRNLSVICNLNQIKSGNMSFLFIYSFATVWYIFILKII